MPENGVDLRRIQWAEVFPFVRLFRTFKRSIDARHLTLGLACVVLCYLAGRVLDSIWCGAGWGALHALGTKATSEVETYAASTSHEFLAWKQQADKARREAVTARERIDAAEQAAEVTEVRRLIDERLRTGLAAVEGASGPSATEKRQQAQSLRRMADYLRAVLAGMDGEGLCTPEERMTAIERIAEADPAAGAAERAEAQARLRRVVAAQQQIRQSYLREPRGPFITLFRFELRCAGAAIRGLCTGRWGFGGGAIDAEPALLSSLVSAGRGLAWLVTQRPGFALIHLLILLGAFGFFGGAICRSAAVRSAREESLSLRAAAAFAREKFGGFVLAPIIPLGILIGTSAILFVGGVFGAIPVLGELLVGLLYGLALLGGVALVFALLGLVFGFSLMWPTIAVEGSDAFDAISHAFSYVIQRAWHMGFYAFVLLLYGGVSFVAVRLMAMLLLKLTHSVTASGMSLFGSVSSSMSDSLGKLDALWRMPAWSDLSVLPGAGVAPFWGTFANVPLSGSETAAMWLIVLWVFAVVGLVAAFAVSFYFCGSTELYLLLRKNVDATDYDEIYYEEEETLEPAPPVEAPERSAAQGTTLPVVGSPSPTGPAQPGDEAH